MARASPAPTSVHERSTPNPLDVDRLLLAKVDVVTKLLLHLVAQRDTIGSDRPSSVAAEFTPGPKMS
jgi:hypothetical protein